jgi:protocatechuate 3,4-dioxygenase beta subunit
MTGQAAGVLLTMKLALVNAKASCAPLAGYAVYAWHCDKDGGYSLYTVANQNYLRGVQETDANGVATFTTIFPGAYLGRWPHVHFEIFPSLASASASGNKIATSQLAFPDDACRAVYASSGYEQSAMNHPQTTLASDGVFRDGATAQLAMMSGDVTSGFVAALTIGISA